ncbi:hypothetical protein OTB20_39470 [Streptomyces sp. H27-H1]|uniref:hypothetical protein n=1 Tax=Streptomyces sp. H27-H1 TaxID=2996461 RepID=UPI00226DC348|nr:hypothetical protein [Streptomyces sp. H27-H1]MCY0932144.1 hypothetical protein [Streptomyces sp. H27-H1]
MQQWALEQVLGIRPTEVDEKPKPRRTQAGTRAPHLATAAQYYKCEGHLRVPRKHVETLTVDATATARSKWWGWTGCLSFWEPAPVLRD